MTLKGSKKKCRKMSNRNHLMKNLKVVREDAEFKGVERRYSVKV